MTPHSLIDIYAEIEKKLDISSLEVRQIINDIFKIVKNKMDNFAEHEAILLNKLGTFEVKQKFLYNKLKYRIMSDEDREKWEDAYYRINVYKESKKLKNKDNEEFRERERIQREYKQPSRDSTETDIEG